MALPLLCKSPVVFFLGGEIKVLPARNFPPGKLRFIIEPQSFVMAEVNNDQFIRKFYVKDEGAGFWEPYSEKESAMEVA